VASVSKKLGIKPGMRVLVRDAPAGFAIDELPAGAELVSDGPAEIALLFVDSQRAIDEAALPAFGKLKPGGSFWVAYPKKSSGIKTDINRDTGWATLYRAGIEPVSQIAIDDTWSALRFRPHADIKVTTDSRAAWRETQLAKDAPAPEIPLRGA
jgi:hypothetical protein